MLAEARVAEIDSIASSPAKLAACFAGEAGLADAGRAGDDDATTGPNGVDDE